MRHRDDIKGHVHAPLDIQEALVRFGGKNYLGEPMYRLVVAESVYEKRGGAWHDWDENLSIAQRGGVNFVDRKEVSGGGIILVPEMYKPTRVEVGVREVKKYPHLHGWVLERWMPTSYFGTQDDWYAKVVPGTSIPLLGPYPDKGDYKLASDPRTDLLSVGELQKAIQASEALRLKYATSTKGDIAQRAADALFDYEETMRKEREEQEYTLRDSLSVLMGTSLGAGRHRNMLAQRAGITSHEGN